MTQAEFIIEKFGGVRPMASKLEIPASTVQRWKNGGYIPARRQTEVLRKAIKFCIDISPNDFFDLNPEAITGNHTTNT